MQINNTTFDIGDKIRSTLMPDMEGIILNINDDGSVLIKVEKRRIIGDLYYWEHVYNSNTEG